MLNLYSELITCLAAASILSLLTGWMLHKSKARKQLKMTNAYWEKRYHELEKVSHTDVENLEEQLQSMAGDAKELQAKNRTLSDSIKANDSSAQKSRAEAIELNRQHAETQDRLQRIIQQKDREILELGNRIHQHSSVPGKTNTAAKTSFPASADDTDALGDGELTYADTVAINSNDIFDATIQMSAHELIAHQGESLADDELEATVVINSSEAIDMEEATVALDDDVLAYARRSSSHKRKD